MRNAVACLVLWVGVSRADSAAPTACSVKLECLPALSADGSLVALPERFAVAFRSIDGKERRRVEIRKSGEGLARANRLLAEGRFARMQSLELPFSASDLNVMTLEAGGVTIRYAERVLRVERGGRAIAGLDLPSAGACTGPWIRSLFLDEKTRTLAIEFEYHDRADCAAPPPTWRILRFDRARR